MFKGQRIAIINGKNMVMDEYDIHLNYLNLYENIAHLDTIKLDIGAFFCNEKYESIIVAYVAPPISGGEFSDVIAGIKC